MSVQYRNQTTGILERVAGFNDTDSILSPSSKNPISNKAVYNALLQKIDKTVTDLINYYDKSQVYTKPEVRALIGSINTLTIEVVSELPTQDISTTTIYFVGPKTGTNNYDEYVYVGGNWVQIGDTTIDLSNYVTSSALTTALQSYYTKTQTDNLFNDYYDKDTTDDLLDAKQDVLEWDNTPTSGSSNPVTSNGIRTAISNAIVSSAGGSIIKVHHLDGSVVAGDTVTASKGSFSVSTTFDNNGDAIITGVGEIGTITITATNGTDVGVAFINTPNFSLYSTTISYGINYKSWLEAGGLNPSSYSSLDEVLEDEEAIRRLFTIHASVDYLTAAIISDNNEDAIKIFNNDLCAKWISLRDYAMDILPTNEHIATIMGDIDKYFYGEWTIMPQVPVMISSTMPYGEAFASSEWGSGYEAYKAFNKDSSASNSGWESAAQSSVDVPSWVAYDFINPIRIVRTTFQVYANNLKQTTCDAYIEGSNDKTNWTRVSEPVTITTDSAAKDYSIEVNTNTAYRYYRLYYTKTTIKSQGGNIYFAEAKLLQFYAWDAKGNIPIMTGYNAPYGTVTESSHTGNWYGWMAFDNTSTTYWCTPANTDGYLIYKFTNPTNVKHMRILVDGVYLTNYTLKASNDNSTWTTLCSGTYDSTKGHLIKRKFNNDNYYLYYQLSCTRYGQYASIKELQLYGREMEAFVPVMTSNTAPYGEAFGTGPVASSYDFYHAFDNTNVVWQGSSSGSGSALGEYIGFKNPHPFIIKQLKLNGGTFNGINAEFTLKGSNDNINYTSITSFNVASGYSSELIVSFDNDIAYSNHILECTKAGGGTTAIVGTLQFYGCDYSEYDWDTENPRHYLYDHGVKPNETLEFTTQGTGMYSEDNRNIMLKKNTSSSSPNLAAVGVNIDCTNYNLVRSTVDDYYSNSAGNTVTMITASTTLGDSDLGYYLYPVSGGTLPNHMAMSLSNINQTCYLNLRINSSVSDIGYSYNTEWWLE